ncbi:MAG: RNA polymerase factor sigma-54 [Phycisphaerales bacterium]|nr:RNA polymerase factor sigma-54 [Phycisphaerales bacterium]
MDMRFETRQQAGLGQQQKLSPRMIQSMEILQMPIQALHERIDQELESNIALEVDEHLAGKDREASSDIEDEELVVGESDTTGDGADDFERLASMEGGYREAIDNEYSFSSWSAARMSGERDRKMDAMANVSAGADNLIDQVLHQWSFAEVAPPVVDAGKVLIAHLNPDGLLDLPIEDIAAAEKTASLDDLLAAQKVLQRLAEPAGIGAATIKECLLLQVEAWRSREGEDAAAWERVRELIESHLDDLVQNRLPVIAKHTGLTLDEIKSALRLMHRLNLSPGREVVDEHVPPVIPDVIVEYDQQQDQYVAALCDGVVPPLRVSPRYTEMSSDTSLDGQTRSFITRNVGNAKWLIESINQRSNAVLRVVQVVLDRQRGWFDEGARGLKMLPMTEVADLLGVHVATVSRAVSEKWMQTPRGIVPLRRFFSGGTETTSGESLSWEAVKALLREIVEAEDSTKPLGDEALAVALREQGVDIARRTVVKYRQQMGIPPARLRKKY